jgi:hypothetical protein
MKQLTPDETRELYDGARRRARAAQARRVPADPQTKLSAPVPPRPRQTVCSCGEFGPCRCAPPSLARAWPDPVTYELRQAEAFYRRYPPGEC